MSSSPVVRASGGSAPTSVTRSLGLLLPCALLVLTQLYVAIPLVSPVAREIGHGNAPAASAALATTYGIAYAVGLLVFGPLSDRYGRKAILVPGLLALAVSTAGVSAADSLGLLGALRGIQGLSAASFPPVALAYLGEALPVRYRATAIGAMSTAFLSAGIVGQVYASILTSAWGWRGVFGLSAALVLLAAIAVAVILREPTRAAPGSSLAQRYRRIAKLAVRRELALPVASAFPVLLSFVAMYAALGPWLQANFGLGQTEILLVRLAGLPAMLLGPLAGALAGRIGARTVLLAGFLVAALGLALEAGAGGSLIALVAASVIFVAGVTMTVPTHIALIGARAGTERAGGLGLYSFVLFVGASVGPLATQLPLGFPVLLLALSALLLAGTGLVSLSSGRAARER
jgi:MFS family permease